MKTDPGIERTREARRRISREFANDIQRLGEYYMQYQRRFADRLRWATGSEHQATDVAAEPSTAAEGADAAVER